MTIPPRILLDLDCTLTDWVPVACAAHGLTWEEVRAVAQPGVYGLHRPIGKLTRGRPLTVEEFWAPIHARPTFWLDLEPTPWCRDLFELVRGMTDDWAIVTSPSECPDCVGLKRRWAARHLCPEAASWGRFVPTAAKYLLAGPGTILIDDSQDNCRRFVMCPRRKEPTGGCAVLVPAHHNDLHFKVGQELDHVLTGLRDLTRGPG